MQVSVANKRPFREEDSGVIDTNEFWMGAGVNSFLEVLEEPRAKKLKAPKTMWKISGQGLGNALAYYTSMGSYYDTLIAKAELDHAIGKHNVVFLRSKLLLMARGRTIAERKAQRNTQPSLLKAKKELLETRALHVMLLTYRRSCDKYYQCISREISRREAEHGKRHGN